MVIFFYPFFLPELLFGISIAMMTGTVDVVIGLKIYSHLKNRSYCFGDEV